MKSYLGSSDWKKRQPRKKINWWPLILLILFSLLVLFVLFVNWNADNIRAICPPQGCSVKAATPKYGTKAWLTMCYNQYDTYKERINLC